MSSKLKKQASNVQSIKICECCLHKHSNIPKMETARSAQKIFCLPAVRLTLPPWTEGSRPLCSVEQSNSRARQKKKRHLSSPSYLPVLTAADGIVDVDFKVRGRCCCAKNISRPRVKGCDKGYGSCHTAPPQTIARGVEVGRGS